MTDNFIKLDPAHPAGVFSREEVDFVMHLDPAFTEDDRRKIFNIEEVLYNKTTKLSNFDLIPGIRHRPRQGCIYYSRFRKGKYDDIVDEFFAYPISKLPEKDKYVAICRGYRILTPPGDTFYPIEFSGNIELFESLYRQSANMLGSDLAKFKGNRFVAEDASRNYLFSEIVIEKMRSRRTPKNW